MGSLIYIYAAIKRQKEQERAASKVNTKPRVLTGGCELYQFPKAKASNQ